ncbi:MAG: SMP-30/gluconolactonase/LRE family protein, partial [Desulfuromonadales bacterium]|nr:SMP-30/gluconolactonase/LRE family protein [Desulfuromonadales bacterium]
LLALPLLLAGCAGAPAKEKLRIFWPGLPDEPKMEFLGVYHSQHSFDKSAAQKRKEAILGMEQVQGFRKPTGIAGDSDKGVVYIADGDAQNIRVFDFNNNTVEFLSKNNIGSFLTGLALDSQGRLWVCDANDNVVLVLDDQGRILKTFGRDVMEKKSYVALNERLGRVYVSDGLGHQIGVFDMDGNHLFTFGKTGDPDTNVFGPLGMAIDDQDRVFVADALNARIQVYDADGNHLYGFGERGDQTWQFESPRDLAFDSDGDLWITDVRKQAFMLYNTEGRLLLFFSAGTKKGTYPLAMGFPGYLWIDQNDRVYVSDQLKLRFAMWQYFSEKYSAAHPLTAEERQKQLDLLNQLRVDAKKK